jgi:hypothetical protein
MTVFTIAATSSITKEQIFKKYLLFSFSDGKEKVGAEHKTSPDLITDFKTERFN